jgi:hypothetical protein
MSGGKQYLDRIQIVLKNDDKFDLRPIYIDVFDNSLSRKWLSALNHLIKNNYHLEKNYCFFGFTENSRNAHYLVSQINESIANINQARLGYVIDDVFTVDNTIITEQTISPGGLIESACCLNHEKMNSLHRYFEDLQGTSESISSFYKKADSTTRWHIRQLNLLCHEYESLVLSLNKEATAPMWKRPSQLMCWLKSPKFVLDEADYDLFGVDTIPRSLGGVFVGVNKAIGKHHWEVFNDEGRDSRVNELTTTAMRGQTQATGDFDIEWANNPANFPWMKNKLDDFKQWLVINGFDPNDKTLTIGHPQVGQVDLLDSFETTDYQRIWRVLGTHLNVHSISTSDAFAEYDYNWYDSDYVSTQIKILEAQCVGF